MRQPIGVSLLYKGSLDLYCLNPEAGMRIDQQITRQQLGAMTGLSDDVLAFWIKNDLIVAASGGEGKGSHRRFDGFQVSIAGMLAELRKFGINLAGLRAFAEKLQRATALGKSAPCHPLAFHDAMELRMKLDDFRDGVGVNVGDGLQGWRPAVSEEEIIKHIAAWPGDLSDTVDNVVACAKSITRDQFPDLRLFLDLHSAAYRYVYDGRAMDWGDAAWLVVRQPDETWEIFSSSPRHDPLPGNLEPDDVPSGIYLMTTAIFRRVWRDRLSPILLQHPEETEENKLIRAELRKEGELRERKRNLSIASAIWAREAGQK